jgi:hypothetical protein
VALSLAAALGCPIQRPPVPREYLDFRAVLESAVADAAVRTMDGDPGIQAALEGRLTALSAYVRVDSVLARLSAEEALEPLAPPVRLAVESSLHAEGVGGDVRDAYESPDGQRLAVDGIIIGLGRALRRLGSAAVHR